MVMNSAVWQTENARQCSRISQRLLIQALYDSHAIRAFNEKDPLYQPGQQNQCHEEIKVFGASAVQLSGSCFPEGFNKNVNLKSSGMITNYEDSIKKIHDCGILACLLKEALLSSR
jgi:hypothetical protein